MFLIMKNEEGVINGKISFYCRILQVTWQGFCKYLIDKDRPWKYAEYDDWRFEDIQALVNIATMENRDLNNTYAAK